MLDGDYDLFLATQLELALRQDWSEPEPWTPEAKRLRRTYRKAINNPDPAKAELRKAGTVAPFKPEHGLRKAGTVPQFEAIKPRPTPTTLRSYGSGRGG